MAASTTVIARDHDIIFLVANCNCIMRLLETGNGYCYSHSDNTKSVKFLEFAGVPVIQPDQQEIVESYESKCNKFSVHKISACAVTEMNVDPIFLISGGNLRKNYLIIGRSRS